MPSKRPRHLFIAASLGTAIGVATFMTVASPSGSGPSDWYWPLLVPSVVGFMLVGGVHGGASDTTVTIAMAIANGVIWALLVLGLLWGWHRVTRRPAGSSSPAT
jgi:hypothetical protein